MQMHRPHIFIHTHVCRVGRNNQPLLIRFLPASAHYCCEYNISNMTSCPYMQTNMYVIIEENMNRMWRRVIKSTGFQLGNPKCEDTASCFVTSYRPFTRTGLVASLSCSKCPQGKSQSEICTYQPNCWGIELCRFWDGENIDKSNW